MLARSMPLRRAPKRHGIFAGARELFRLTLEGTGAAANTVYTFAHGFKRGDVPPDASVLFRNGATSAEYRTQCDKKTFYSDGSVEHALLAVEMPLVAEGATLELKLMVNEAHSSPGTTIDLATALIGRAAVACVTPVAGVEWQYNLIANLPAARWRSGPLVSEARIETVVPTNTMGDPGAAPNRSSDGGRLVCDLWLTKDGQLHVHQSVNNDSSDYPSAGFRNANFSARILIDGVEEASHPARVVVRNTRMTMMGGRKSGAPMTYNPFWVKPNKTYMALNGWCLPYNTANALASSLYTNWSASLARAGWGAANYPTVGGEHRDLNTFLPAGGDRPELGMISDANAAWIAEGNKIAQRMAQDQAHIFTSCEGHYWDRTEGNWVRRDTMATQIRYDNTATVHVSQTHYTNTGGEGVWQFGNTHLYGLMAIPYAMRGLRGWLDTIVAHGSYLLGLKGGTPNLTTFEGYDYLDGDVTVRSSAYSLRQITDICRFLPSSDSLRTYFSSILAGTLSKYISNLASYNTAQGQLAHVSHAAYQYGDHYSGFQAYYLFTALRASKLRGEAEAANAATYLENMATFMSNVCAQTGSGFPQERMAFYFDLFVAPSGGGPILTTWAAFKTRQAAFSQNYALVPDGVMEQYARAWHLLYQIMYPSDAANNAAVTTIAGFGATGNTAPNLALNPRNNI